MSQLNVWSSERFSCSMKVRKDGMKSSAASLSAESFSPCSEMFLMPCLLQNLPCHPVLPVNVASSPYILLLSCTAFSQSIGPVIGVPSIRFCLSLVKLFVVAKPHCFCLRTHAHVCHLAFEHEYLRLFFLISETVLYAILYLVAIAVEELPPSNMSITSVLSSMDKITSLRFLVADPVTMLACYSCYSYAHTFSVKV